MPTGNEQRGRRGGRVAVRQQIVAAALAAYARSDVRGPTLRSIAEDVGLSERDLEDHFASRDELLVAVVQERDRHDEFVLSSGPEPPSVSLLVALIGLRNTQTPGATRLFIDVLMAARDVDHPSHGYFAHRYDRYRRRLAEILVHERGLDEETSVVAATALVALADGLQLQWLVDPCVDVTGVLRFAVERLGVAGPEDHLP